jgi:hypothetical protein
VLAADQRITAWARQLKKAGLDGDMDVLRARAYLDLLLGKDSRPRRDTGSRRDDAAGQDSTGSRVTVSNLGTATAEVGKPTRRSVWSYVSSACRRLAKFVATRLPSPHPPSRSGLACGDLMFPLILGNDVDATADHGSDQAFVPEHLDGLLDASARYPVLLRKTVDRRKRTPRRYLPAFDLPAQDFGELPVNRHVSIVIDRHMADCK